MRTENQTWTLLREHAAAQIRPGFPERVLKAARAAASPLFITHFAMCAATAAACVVVVALYHARISGDEDTQSVAGWGEIVAQANDFEQGL